MSPLTQGGVLAQVSWLIKWFPSPAVTENSTHTHTHTAVPIGSLFGARPGRLFAQQGTATWGLLPPVGSAQA